MVPTPREKHESIGVVGGQKLMIRFIIDPDQPFPQTFFRGCLEGSLAE